MEKMLIMLCGLPRSGKSTHARSCPYPIVNADSVRLAFHGHKFIPVAEPWVWAFTKLMVRALFLAGHDKVILDSTNIDKRRRDEWISRSWTRKVIVFDVSKETCITRAGNDLEIIPIIERMSSEYQEPTTDEGFIEIIKFSEDSQNPEKRELL